MSHDQLLDYAYKLRTEVETLQEKNSSLKRADGGGIRLRESRLYATEEDAKKAIQKPYVKPKLYWGLDE